MLGQDGSWVSLTYLFIIQQTKKKMRWWNLHHILIILVQLSSDAAKHEDVPVWRWKTQLRVTEYTLIYNWSDIMSDKHLCAQSPSSPSSPSSSFPQIKNMQRFLFWARGDLMLRNIWMRGQEKKWSPVHVEAVTSELVLSNKLKPSQD